MKSRAPQLHLEYRFYKALGSNGTLCVCSVIAASIGMFLARVVTSILFLL